MIVKSSNIELESAKVQKNKAIEQKPDSISSMTVHLPRYIYRTFSKSVAVSEIHNVARYKNARHIWQLRTAGQF